MSAMYERKNSTNTLEYFYEKNGNKIGFFITTPELPGVVIEITEIAGIRSGPLGAYKNMEELCQSLNKTSCRYYRFVHFNERIELSRVNSFGSRYIKENSDYDLFYYAVATDLEVFNSYGKVVYKKFDNHEYRSIEIPIFRKFWRLNNDEKNDQNFNHAANIEFSNQFCSVKFNAHLQIYIINCDFEFRKIVSQHFGRNRQYNWGSTSWYVDVSEYEKVREYIEIMKNVDNI